MYLQPLPHGTPHVECASVPTWFIPTPAAAARPRATAAVVLYSCLLGGLAEAKYKDKRRCRRSKCNINQRFPRHAYHICACSLTLQPHSFP